VQRGRVVWVAVGGVLAGAACVAVFTATGGAAPRRAAIPVPPCYVRLVNQSGYAMRFQHVIQYPWVVPITQASLEAKIPTLASDTVAPGATGKLWGWLGDLISPCTAAVYWKNAETEANADQVIASIYNPVIGSNKFTCSNGVTVSCIAVATEDGSVLRVDAVVKNLVSTKMCRFRVVNNLPREITNVAWSGSGSGTISAHRGETVPAGGAGGVWRIENSTTGCAGEATWRLEVKQGRAPVTQKHDGTVSFRLDAAPAARGSAGCHDRFCTVVMTVSTPTLLAFDIVFGGLRAAAPPDGADVIEAGGDADHVDAGAGDDTVVAGAGDDVVSGGPGNDDVAGGTGNDVIRVGAGDDAVSGGPGDDHIFAGAGNDVIDAGPGNDTIYARDGERDTVYCGPGRDFVTFDPQDVLVGCESGKQ
jgi:hypothetical protein